MNLKNSGVQLLSFIHGHTIFTCASEIHPSIIIITVIKVGEVLELELFLFWFNLL